MSRPRFLADPAIGLMAALARVLVAPIKARAQDPRLDGEISGR